MTFAFGSAVAGVTKRVGYYSTSDGIFLEENGTVDLAIVKRSSVSGSAVDTRVAQSDWNLDTLDGSGGTRNPSGITLDQSKAQILMIDLQWLGVGRVRVGFDVDGQVFYAHEFLHANSVTTTYMSTATLPVRWEITGDSAASMKAICSAIASEGGAEKPVAHIFSYDRAAITAGDDTQTYAFSIRLAPTFEGKANHIYFLLERWRLTVTGNYPVLLEVYYDTTVGGTPSWGAYAPLNGDSGIQFDTAGTPSGGVKIASFVVAASATVNGGGDWETRAIYPLSLLLDEATPANMTVYVTAYGGNSVCYPGMSWSEIR
jgi:hypothetical protein